MLAWAERGAVGRGNPLAARLRTPAPPPPSVVSLPRVTPDNGDGTVVLAEMGTNVVEFATVARITGNDTYRELAEKPLRAVHAANDKVCGVVGGGETLAALCCAVLCCQGSLGAAQAPVL